MKKLLSILAVSVFAFSANAGTLDDVKNRGFLKCGVTTGLIGFAAPDDAGEWTGFDVDVCRAVAAAIFGDSSKVEFTTTTGKSRFPTLASGEIDMLARNTTWTLSRDVNLGFEFVGVNFYDPGVGNAQYAVTGGKDITSKICFGNDSIHYKVKPGTMILIPGYTPHQYPVDLGLDPFRFIHWNIQAVSSSISKEKSMQKQDELPKK